MLRYIYILIAFAVVGTCATARCATISSVVKKDGKVLLTLDGEIIEGDAERIKQEIQIANQAGRLVSGIRLNSAGGNLLDGVKIADIVKYGKISTGVQTKAVCASACFVIFAAGSEKYANYAAQIGVHGASEPSGQESVASNAATVVMAKVIKELGVPANIIGKMVVTPPSEMVWLSPNDLRAMGATMIGRPSQTPPEAKNNVGPPLQVNPSVQAREKPAVAPTWKDLADAALERSKAQNKGRAVTSRNCQPELGVCNTAVFFKNNKGKQSILRVTENVDGKIIAHDICEFNEFMDIRSCVRWETGAELREMKDSKGNWIKAAGH